MSQMPKKKLKELAKEECENAIATPHTTAEWVWHKTSNSFALYDGLESNLLQRIKCVLAVNVNIVDFVSCRVCLSSYDMLTSHMLFDSIFLALFVWEVSARAGWPWIGLDGNGDARM
ncbi:hypothetical protein KC19_VG149200 [Ceratodon purpureus]|uniref:Uncharacterized protein n=1 Tax=Ceratodon purpureus TaxID=3225 RepID=A0A8T0HQB5_CERPU|nr:hypothetical protein KC19_VG149200 [Ceratodon purpureus]